MSSQTGTPPGESKAATASDETFGGILARLRRKYFSKQVALAAAIGATDAAICYWESGKRMPKRDSMRALVAALLAAGADSYEIAELRVGWEKG